MNTKTQPATERSIKRTGFLPIQLGKKAFQSESQKLFINTPTKKNVQIEDQTKKQSPNMTISPRSDYYNGYNYKLHNSKSIDLLNNQKQPNIQNTIRQLTEKISKLNYKVIKHESILIKITQNSIEQNKQDVKKSNFNLKNTELIKMVDSTNQNISKLKKDFQEHLSSSKKSSLQVELSKIKIMIKKLQENMKSQIQNISKNSIETIPKPILNDEKMQEINKYIKNVEKGISTNSNKISLMNQKVDSMNSSLEGHIDLMNAQVNKAISKIVNFVNEKVSKPTNESINQLILRMDKVQKEKRKYQFNNYKSSYFKSEKEASIAQYKQSLFVYNKQIIICEKFYHIDVDGYLLDKDYFYLIDNNDERIKLGEQQIQKLKTCQIME